MYRKYLSLVSEIMGETLLTLTLSGESSILESYYFPPIELSPHKGYVLGLIELLTFNSIPNIDNIRNQIKIGNQLIKLPSGSYEITDIDSNIKKASEGSGKKFSLTANNNTLKSEINCSEQIDLKIKRSIALLLGLPQLTLEANKPHISSSLVRILKFNVLIVECNITTGAYINNQKVHTIHEFFPAVPPGYKIIEIPSKVT